MTEVTEEAVGTDLVDIRKIEPRDVFTPEVMTPLLVGIRAKALEKERDVTTKEGRKAIKSMAYEISRTKTCIDEHRIKLVEPMKAEAKAIDGVGKTARDTLSAFKIEYRQPLTEWEEADEKRLEAIRISLLRIKESTDFSAGFLSSHEIQQRIDQIKDLDIPEFEEFAEDAIVAVTAALAMLDTKLEDQRKYEQDQKDLQRLREAEQKRLVQKKLEDDALAKKKREEKIKADATLEAEREAEEKIKAAEVKTADAEIETKKATRLARARIKGETAIKTLAEQDRQAEPDHRKKIEQGAIDSFAAIHFLTPEQAQDIVDAIVQGNITNVSLNY